MDAEKIFDLDVFKSNPGFYYENTKEFIYGLDEKEPAVTHRVLSKLEEKGYVKTLITQNIDMLHQKAGSKNVIELHGSAKVHYCMKCGMETSEKSVFEVARRGEVPKCSSCGRSKASNNFFWRSFIYGCLKPKLLKRQKMLKLLWC